MAGFLSFLLISEEFSALLLFAGSFVALVPEYAESLLAEELFAELGITLGKFPHSEEVALELAEDEDVNGRFG